MISSPYLHAIQTLAGSIPGEKYKTLNHLARTIIAASVGQSKSIQVQSSTELPEILIPLVKLEIAKILRQPDEIFEALKSDDIVVFNRALRVKWFFDGTIETVTNVDYFRDRILGCISMKNRLRLIKTLSNHLAAKKKSSIAEKFYSTLSDMYGNEQPEPLLCACSESFIWDTIITRQLVLSPRLLARLYLKYPDIIVRYLKLSEPNKDPYDRNMHKIPMNLYVSFLPRLVKNHTDLFVDLIKSNDYLYIKLSRKCTETFLKKKIDILIENPIRFCPLMNLKTISSKLTKEQFKLFFRNLFPINTSETNFMFSFMEMYNYLEYHPTEERVPLILSTFKQVYGKSFLEYDDLLEPAVLRLLSPEDRVHAARKKIEKNPQWPMHSWDLESSWRCYLPISESIQILKNQIKKTSDAERRRGLLIAMIHSCKVNNDVEALLEVLKYIATRHRNEHCDALLTIIDRLMDEFEIQYLSHEHWKILDNIIDTLNVKDQLLSMEYVTRGLFQCKIHFNLIHSLPITELIKFLSTLIKHDCFCRWNILQYYPEYERKCLEEFIKVASSSFSEEESTMDLVDSFLSSINDFNERISKAKCEIEPIAIKNEWLLTQISRHINSDEGEELRLNLKKYDPVLYDTSVTNNKNDQMIDLVSTKEFNEWKTNPDRIEKHWEKYLAECKYEIHKKYARRFIKICRWHQNLPIKFMEECVRDVTENKNKCALMVLALLFEGPVFECFIEKFLPTSPTIDINAEEAKENYSILQSIPLALMIVNPPVSLNVTSRLCAGDTIHMTANWLIKLSRKTSVDKLIPFATKLMDQPVSVSKHFIRIFSTAASIEECHTLYINLWRNEKHQTIRTLVFGKIFHLFVSYPNDETWLMITECIDNLTANDKDSLNSMCCLEKIHNKYIARYVQRLFATLKKFHNVVDDVDPQFIWSHIAQLLRLPDNIAVLFSEELHHEILQTYFADLSLPSNVSIAAQYYLANAYINPALDKLGSRLIFYSDMFVDILQNQWDIPDPHRPNVYPANYMVDSRMVDLLHHMKDNEAREKFIDVTLKAYLSVLNPLQAPVFYLTYVFASLYRQPNMSRKDYAYKIGEIMPSLIATFSVEFIVLFSDFVGDCLELLWKDCDTRHEVTLDVIESLLELNTEQTTLLAITIPTSKEVSSDARYANILRTLRQHKNPAIVANAASEINRLGFEDS